MCGNHSGIKLSWPPMSKIGRVCKNLLGREYGKKTQGFCLQRQNASQQK